MSRAPAPSRRTRRQAPAGAGAEPPGRRPPPWRSPLVVPALTAAAIGVGVALAQTAVLSGIDSLLPDARRINSFNRPGTLTVLSEDGQVVLKQGPATREKLASGKMPLLVQRAFIAAEDRRFYQHDGIDPVGILRAVVRNLRQGSVEEGASTITQQLARTVFLSQDRTVIRKLREAALAGKIERQLSKAQILEQYLNVVYLGSSAYGAADAAWVYFSKTPEQLTLAEAAMIAGLPPAPSVYSPLVNPELALERRSTVLRRMREAGFIDDTQLARAESEPLGLKPAEPKYFMSRAPWFTSWLQQELPRVLSKEQLEVGGLTVRTGLNMAWQEKAQTVIDSSAPAPMQGALVAMEPGTGLVRAMVGGHDWTKSQFNRATHALRSPGSTFKLFTYTAALDAGMKPEDTVSNLDQCYAGFCVRSTGRVGRTTLTYAVTRSLNAAAVATARKVGYPRVIAMAHRLGIDSELGEYPSMVIGANEQYVIDMTAAYAAVNNRGIFVKPSPFEEIYGPDGELLWSRRVDGAKLQKPHRAVSSDVADAIMWMLQQVVVAGTGGGAALPDRPVAGKTGTSEGARDLWFIGSIPQLTTGIWLGYDDNGKTRSSSAQAAAAWYDFMLPVSKQLPVRQFPPKPVLTGPFIPYKPSKDRRNQGDQGAGTGRWSPQEQPPRDERGPVLQPPERDQPRWEPPPSEPGATEPPVEQAPQLAPASPGDAPAPPPAATPAAPLPAPPPAPAPVPVSPPPPVSAPPPP